MGFEFDDGFQAATDQFTPTVEQLNSTLEQLGKDVTFVLSTLQERLQELEQTRADAALVVHALTCAIQFSDTLMLFLPEGQPLPEELGACKHSLDQALTAIGARR